MHEVKPPLQSVLGRYRLTCCDWVLVLHFRKEVDQTQSVREHKSLLGKKRSGKSYLQGEIWNDEHKEVSRGHG